MSIISLIVVLVLFSLAFWVVKTLTPVLGLPSPVVTVLYVILVVLFVLWLLQTFIGVTSLRVQ